MSYSMLYKSPVGNLEVVTDGEVVTQLEYLYQHTHLRFPTNNELSVFKKVRKWLDNYFLGNNPEIDFTLQPHGTPFQQEVWSYLSTIPYGELTTYGTIAKHIGQLMNKPKMSAQAVGGAVGKNPISIIIPCHRVVGKDGSLTGYGGTIDNKIKLLGIENIDMGQLYRPRYATKP